MAAPSGLDTPMLHVQQVVVAPAQQHQVVRLCRAAIEPVLRMVSVASGCGDVAARPTAAVVANEEEGDLSIGDQAAPAAVVDDVAERIGEVAVQCPVTGVNDSSAILDIWTSASWRR